MIPDVSYLAMPLFIGLVALAAAQTNSWSENHRGP
jgi:hypothetical protein